MFYPWPSVCPSVCPFITPNRIENLCNLLLLEFLSKQCETSHICYSHIEDVHVTFWGRKHNF